MNNLVEDVKEYFIDIISLLLLIASLVFLFYNTYYNPLIEYNKTIEKLSNNYKEDEKALHIQLNNITKVKEDTKVIELDTVPALLKRINDTCKAPNVIIRTLKPTSDNPFQFELNFISNYFDFLEVLSEFEKLNIVIHKIDIRPYEIKKRSPKHIITLNIEAINGGEKLSKKDVIFLEEELKKTKKRDPFQRFAKIGKNIKRLIDLTWIHKLSGIGKIDGQYVATINSRIYYKGDSFNSMIKSKITSNEVYLRKNTSNGSINYILGFRHNAKDKKNEEK
jgi:hypothetical protein